MILNTGFSNLEDDFPANVSGSNITDTAVTGSQSL
jgi:hypothetical protein